jgi:uncharacterized protein with von Willebrand factor type A (vWA) domain
MNKNPPNGFEEEDRFDAFLKDLWSSQDHQSLDGYPDEPGEYEEHVDPFSDDDWAWQDEFFSVNTWDDLGSLGGGSWKDYKTDSESNITVLDNISEFSAGLSSDILSSSISGDQVGNISRLAKLAEISLAKVLQNDLFHLIFKTHAPPKKRAEITQSVDHPILSTQLINNLNIINLLYRSPRYGEIKKDTSLNVLASAAVMPDLIEGMLSLYLRLKNREGFGEESSQEQQDLFANSLSSDTWGSAVVQAIQNSGMNSLISSIRIKLSGLESSLSSWGLSMSEVAGMSQKKQMMLYKIFNSDFHAEIMRTAKKFLGSAHAKVKTMVKTRITKNTVVQGIDLQNMMLRDKMLMKVAPKYFMYKVAEGKILSLVGFKTKNKGPVVMCIDDSGSMAPPSGAPAKWARTVFIAIAQNLIKSDRSLHACLFSGDVPDRTKISLTHKDMKASRIEKSFAFIDLSLGGGTSFVHALDWAFKKITTDAPLADIIFITDGQCNVDETRMISYAKKKRDCKSKFYLVLIQNGSPRYPSIAKLADKTYHINIQYGDGYEQTIKDITQTADIIKKTMI